MSIKNLCAATLAAALCFSPAAVLAENAVPDAASGSEEAQTLSESVSGEISVSAFGSLAPSAVSGNFVESLASGSIDWMTGDAVAVGTATLPPLADQDAALSLARRNAVAAARRGLLETVRSVRVYERLTVGGLIRSDTAKNDEVRATLQNSVITLREDPEQGFVAAEARVSLHGEFAGVILSERLYNKVARQLAVNSVPQPEVRPEPVLEVAIAEEDGDVTDTELSAQPDAPIGADGGALSDPPAEAAAAEFEPAVDEYAGYTGVIIDARGTGARPSLCPGIVGSRGTVVFGPGVVSRGKAIDFGMIGYAANPEKARVFGRVSPSPLRLKAVTALGHGSRIVLDEKDAGVLRRIAERRGFFERCRVVVVID